MASYWRDTLERRISRRRALAAGAVTTAAAAFLAACGGDDEGDGTAATGSTGNGSTGSGSSTGATTTGSSGTGSTGGATSGLLAPVEDTSANAKQGGIWQTYITADLQSLDPYQVTAGSAHAPWTYSRLVRYIPGTYPENATSDVEPDGASSWEESPDGLTFTFHLREDLKLDPRPPTSGRLIDAEDVVFSAEKFRATGLSRSEFYNEFAPTSPVESVEAIDPKTVQVKLAFPIANMMARFAFQRYLYIMPKEADGAFDPANDMRGSGPWRLVKWEPSQGFTYERNDEWTVAPGQPYLDGLNVPIITEYAQRRAQLVAGNLWSNQGLTAEDVLGVKSEQPGLNLYAQSFPDTRPVFLNFGLLPDSPFHDVRVRRAASMVIDRDLYIETIYNVTKFESEGLPIEWAWHTHYAAGEPPYWIDPKGSGLGEPAKYFHYNVEEATKMVEAAGLELPLSMPAYIGTFGNASQKEALHALLNDSGIFNFQLTSVERNEYLPNYFNGGGVHDGVVLDNGPGASGDIDAHISVRFNVGAAPQVFYREVFPWYEKTQQLVEAQRVELDREKRLGILKDLQIEMADQMVAVPWPGIASGFEVAWPYFANYLAFTPRSIFTEQSETWPRFWYDASKA